MHMFILMAVYTKIMICQRLSMNIIFNYVVSLILCSVLMHSSATKVNGTKLAVAELGPCFS